MSADPLLSPAQVAAYLNVSIKTVHEWCRKGLLPGIKLGRLWRFKESDLRTVLATQQSKVSRTSNGT